MTRDRSCAGYVRGGDGIFIDLDMQIRRCAGQIARLVKKSRRLGEW